MLIRWCEDCIQKILDAVATHNSNTCLMLKHKFEFMNEQLTQPFEQVGGLTLEQLKGFRESLRQNKKEINRCQPTMKDVRVTMMLLLEYHYLLGPAASLYARVFNWQWQIVSTVGDSAQKFKDAHCNFEDALYRRIDEFEKTLDKVDEHVEELSLLTKLTETSVNVSKMITLEEEVAEADNEKIQLNEIEAKLERHLSDFTALHVYSSRLDLLSVFWKGYAKYRMELRMWMTSSVKELVSADIAANLKCLKKLLTDSKASFRKQNWGHLDKTCLEALKEVQDFVQHMPLIELISSPALEMTHFVQISEALSLPLTGDDSLRQAISLDMDHRVDEIKSLVAVAEEEYKVRCEFKQMEMEWYGVQFVLHDFETSDVNTHVIPDTNEISRRIGDQILQAYMLSVEPMAKKIISNELTEWRLMLEELQGLIVALHRVQVAYVFSSQLSQACFVSYIVELNTLLVKLALVLIQLTCRQHLSNWVRCSTLLTFRHIFLQKANCSRY